MNFVEANNLVKLLREDISHELKELDPKEAVKLLRQGSGHLMTDPAAAERCFEDANNIFYALHHLAQGAANDAKRIRQMGENSGS